MLAIAASIASSPSILSFIGPRKRKCLRQVTLAAEQAKQGANAGHATDSLPACPSTTSVQATMTF
jgi:hypothetical protein